MAVNLSEAILIAKTLTKLALGKYDITQVEKAVRDERLSACKGCDRYNATTGQCRLCGCFMSIKTRLLYDPVETERVGGEKQKTVCPQGLW